MSEKNRQHFYIFDSLRGLGALAVVLFHLGGHEGMKNVIDASPGVVAIALSYGTFGVAVFFVLSGFVISYSLDRWRQSRFDKEASWFKYVAKRLIRLTPPYYAAIVVALVFALLAAATSGEDFEPGLVPFSFTRFLAHLFYVQEIVGFINFNDVFWTLAIELQFYLVLVMLWWVREKVPFGNLVIPVAALACLAWPFALVAVEGRSPWFAALFYSFCAGSLLHEVWKQRLPIWTPLAYVGLLFVALVAGGPNPGFLITTIGTTLLILSAIKFDGLSSWLSRGSFRWLGKISYSLYLIHTPILGAAFVVVFKIFGEGSLVVDLFAATLAVVASLIGATFFYYLFELPSIKFGSKIRAADKASVGPVGDTA